VIQEPQQKIQRLPTWVAGLAVLLLLAGSTYALYRLVWQEKKSVAVEAVPLAPSDRGYVPPGAGPRVRSGPMPTGPVSQASVSRSLSGRIRARHGGVVVYGIPKQPSGYDSILEFENARTWVTPTQWDTQILAGRPIQYPALAKEINFTEEQKQKIEALAYQPPLTAAEKADFDKLFTAWFKANQREKDVAAEALSLAVQNAAKAHLAEAQAALQKRCAEVTTILSAEQMQQIREWFNSSPKSKLAAPNPPPPPGGLPGTGAAPASTDTAPALKPQ
jgi:hypothetical protein